MLPLCGNLLLALIRRCGGMVDTGDLKSPGSDTVPVRVRSPAPLFEYRGVEQLVARRAHNPEVGGSSPPSATTKAAVFDMKTTAFITFLASPILTHRNNSTLVQLALKIQAFFKNTSAKMSVFFLSAASIT